MCRFTFTTLSLYVICHTYGSVLPDRHSTITLKQDLVSFSSSKLPKSNTEIEASPKFNMSGVVGAEYTPWRATNQLWWHNYSQYRSDVLREVKLMHNVLGFRSLRVFLHDMVWDADSETLKNNIHDFLDILDSENMSAGFVFFDDCWAHSGANLSITCIPKKGVHNGCWVAGPQDVKRTNVSRFEGYVSGIVSHFATDKRVAWWEIFNEPQGSAFSLSLRDAAFRWAKQQNPTAPVLSCWNDNNNTEVVDVHQYSDKWSNSPIFSNPAKGGLITEAGCRWYQQDKDHGSPLTLVNWLSTIRKGGPAVAPFVPGVMLSWEVMVGHSMTRWNWLAHEGSPEPAVPWCGSLYPDGTPVSYTEAAALRRYMGHEDDFLYLNTWLQPNVGAGEAYFTINEGQQWEGWTPKESPAAGALYEISVWAASGDGSIVVTAGGFNVTLSITTKPRTCSTTKYFGCPIEGKRPGWVLPTVVPITGTQRATMTNELCASLCKDANFKPFNFCGTERGGHYCMCGNSIDTKRYPLTGNCSIPCPGNKTEMCGGEPAPGGTGDAVSAYYMSCTGGDPSPNMHVAEGVAGGKVLATKNITDRLVGQGWNILRILAEPDRVRIWLNPNFADITGASVPPADLASPPHAPAPLIDVHAERSSSPTLCGLRAATLGGPWSLDYASVLPPVLFGSN